VRGLAPAVLAAALAASCGGGASPPAPAPPAPAAALRLVPLAPGPAPAPVAATRVARVEVASTPEARERGLMNRASLAEDTGMLFAYPDERPRRFWMKNCRIALSAAFLDGNGRIVRVVEMEPGEGRPDADIPLHESGAPARYVLEMAAGWFRAAGIREGDLVDVVPALGGVVPR